MVSDCGKMPRLVTKYKPDVCVISYSQDSQVVRQMNFVRGVFSYPIPAD